MKDCCRATLKQFIEHYDNLGYIDLHGDITAESEIENFIQAQESKQ